MTDWPAALRARIDDLELPLSEVDALAGLGVGHTSKILNGDKHPTTVTLAKLLDALALKPQFVVDAEREAIMRPQWKKRRR